MASAAPAHDHVFWASEPVRPNETVLLAGDELDQVTQIRIRRLGGESTGASETIRTPQAWETVAPLQTTPTSLKFVVPAEWKNGVFACELKAQDWTQTLLLNDAEVWWMQGDGGEFATPGGTLRVFGRLAGMGTPAEASFMAPGGAPISLKTDAGDAYAQQIPVPDKNRAAVIGEYGWGASAESRAPDFLKMLDQKGNSAIVLTQLTDVETESNNGRMKYDRTLKGDIPAEEVGPKLINAIHQAGYLNYPGSAMVRPTHE